MVLITNELLEHTKLYWQIKEHTIFHNAISLVISQQVSFKVGRNTRTKLFALIGSSDITQEKMLQLNNTDLEQIGLSKNKFNLIKSIINIHFSNDLEFINKLSQLNGIGIWTVKALQILNFNEPNVFLCEDLWIRKRLSELLGVSKILTIRECDIFVKMNCTINKSHLSRFLWRIKPEGIIALKNKQVLTHDHFL